MHIPGWETVTSHFEFLQHDYQTSFGMSGKDKLSYIEDFSFSFKIHREFLGPFISHLIPTLVISVMLFALLLMTRDDKKNEKNMIGFSAMQILSSSGGLFFVLIISHNNLRSTSEIPKVIYLENFYFILYFAIVFIAINALLFITNKEISFIHYRENLLPKLLYWPILLGTSLIVTLNYFS